MHVIKFIILSYGHILIFTVNIVQPYKILCKRRKCDTKLANLKFCVAEFMNKTKTYIGDSNIKFWCDLILVEL